MVKITGPLLSNTASGIIGERLVFSRRATGQQVRFQRAQKDVITATRTAQRFKFSMARDWWLMLNDSEKYQWLILSRK